LIWFTGCWHLGHGNIIKYSNRNQFLFQEDRDALEANGGVWHHGSWKGPDACKHKISNEAVELMDSTILGNTNTVVNRDDILYILGDYSLPGKNIQLYVDKCTEYRERINCRDVRIIWGNHDRPDLIDHLFESSNYYEELSTPKGFVALFHYPIVDWHSSHRGSFHLHSHTHSAIEEWKDEHMPGHRSLDVGIDNADRLLVGCKPFSLDWVLNYFDDKPGFNFGRDITLGERE
jgi:calcineurin-like phosphoesterase family protein